MNGAQIRASSSIQNLFKGFLFLLFTIPFNIYMSNEFFIYYFSSMSVPPPFTGVSIGPYFIQGNQVLYYGIDVELFIVGISISLLIGILYAISFHFMHLVFKFSRRELNKPKSGYYGFIVLFAGFLISVILYFEVLIVLLYRGTYDYTTGMELSSLLSTLYFYPSIIAPYTYIAVAALLISGIFLISAELFKISMKFSSSTLAIGAVTLFIFISPLLSSFFFSILFTLILYIFSIAPIAFVLSGLRDVLKKIKGERESEIQIPYL